MISSQCPRCSESLRIPTTDLPDGAFAQCPWCHETFPADELIDRLPPVVQLMDAQGQPIEVTTAATVASAMSNPFSQGADAGVALADHGDQYDPEIGAADTWVSEESDTAVEAESVGAETVAEDDDQYFDELKFDDEPTGQTTIDIQPGPDVAAPEHQPMRVRSKPSSRKKKSNLRTMLAVAIGPFLAVPLAGAILLAGNKMGLNSLPDLGFWVFDGRGAAKEERRAAPPMDRGASKPGQPKQLASKPPGQSLLPDSGSIADTVNEINADKTEADSDTRPSNITDLKSGPIRMPDALPPPPSINPDKAEPTREEVLRALTADDPQDDGKDELEMPDGIARYPNDTQAVSDPDKTSDDGDKPSQVVLKPSVIVTTDAADPMPEVVPDVTQDVTDAAKDPEPVEPKLEDVVSVPQPEPKRETPELPPELSKAADSPELLAAVSKASSALENLKNKRNEPDDVFKRLLARTFVDLSAVGIQEANVDSESIDGLLSEIAGSKLLKDLSSAGPQWLNYGARPNKGMLLVGKADARKNTITLFPDVVVEVTLPAGVVLPDSGNVVAVGQITSSDNNPKVAVTAIKALQ